MLQGQIRESISKRETKSLRNDGYLIANIYGRGHKNIHCAFKANEFIKYIKQKTSLIFPVKVGENSYEVVIQEYQKDPVSNTIVHIDLLLAQKGILTKYKVPVRVKGSAKGLKNKGVLFVSTKRISVKCAAENLPNEYEIDVSNLDVGDSILVRDLPQINGVSVLNAPAVAIVGVIKAK